MCREPNDLYQLFKASERVSLLLESGGQPEVVLRKWVEMEPSMEFRCFVKDGDLRAICQRVDTQYFPFLVAKLDQLEDVIGIFVDEIVTPAMAEPSCKNMPASHLL